MAYTRWSDSDWYIFWMASSREQVHSKNDERLAIWHVETARDGSPASGFLIYSEAEKALESKRLPDKITRDPRNRIPHWDPEVEEAIRTWIGEVNEAWSIEE